MNDTAQLQHHVALALLLVALLSGAFACEPLEDLAADACNVGEGTTVLAGDWVITGEGSREGCDDAQLNGTFKLGPSQALRIDQSGVNNDKLTLSTPVSGFVLDGTVTGSCTTFSTEEDWKGKVILRTYSGVVTPGGNIEGTFTGNGPTSCRVEGTFLIEVD